MHSVILEWAVGSFEKATPNGAHDRANKAYDNRRKRIWIYVEWFNIFLFYFFVKISRLSHTLFALSCKDFSSPSRKCQLEEHVMHKIIECIKS